MTLERPNLIAMSTADAASGGSGNFSGETAASSLRDGAMQWAAIAVFAAAPWICTWSAIVALPNEPPESAEKAAQFDQRGVVDTVIVGDSRVMRIAEGPFAARGWNYFNFGLSGVSPEDMAMELKYAMTHGKIRRVVMGVSFEGMTERFPFEFSRFWNASPFAAAEIRDFAATGQGEGRRAASRERISFGKDILPMGQANVRLRYFAAKLTGQYRPASLPNGEAAYTAIQSRIETGAFDFEHERDPKIYFDRADCESRYLERAELAAHVRQLYRQVFAALREAKIPCVVYETPRTTAYQRMLDDREELSRLQAQWRDFFRNESGGLIKFLDVQATRDCVNDADFFDAVHFIGPTEQRLAVRLANELAALKQ